MKVVGVGKPDAVTKHDQRKDKDDAKANDANDANDASCPNNDANDANDANCPNNDANNAKDAMDAKDAKDDANQTRVVVKGLPVLPIMTPARFDLLRVVYFNTSRWVAKFRFAERYHHASQHKIREQLGLSASTVSKMITRLVELGLLTRERRVPADRRTNKIKMTALGVRLFQEALQLLCGGRELAKTFETLVCGPCRIPTRKRWKLHQGLFKLFETIHDMARHLGDTSTHLLRFRREEDEGQPHREPWMDPKQYFNHLVQRIQHEHLTKTCLAYRPDWRVRSAPLPPLIESPPFTESPPDWFEDLIDAGPLAH